MPSYAMMSTTTQLCYFAPHCTGTLRKVARGVLYSRPWNETQLSKDSTAGLLPYGSTCLDFWMAEEVDHRGRDPQAADFSFVCTTASRSFTGAPQRSAVRQTQTLKQNRNPSHKKGPDINNYQQPNVSRWTDPATSNNKNSCVTS